MSEGGDTQTLLESRRPPSPEKGGTTGPEMGTVYEGLNSYLNSNKILFFTNFVFNVSPPRL